MPTDLLGYICAATVAAGGIIGYTKAASIPSLTAGLAFGSLLGVGAYYTSQDPPRPVLQLGTACVLAAMMGARWTKSGNFMPGGIVCLISCAVVVRDLYFYNKYLPLPGSRA